MKRLTMIAASLLLLGGVASAQQSKTDETLEFRPHWSLNVQGGSGIRLAKNLLSSGFVDMVSLAKNVSMIELDVKPEWVKKNLIELNLRKKYSVNVVAIHKGESVSVDIDPHTPLQADDKLIVIVNTKKLSKLI